MNDEKDKTTWTDFLIVLLIGAVALLCVFCYQQNQRIKKLETQMNQIYDFVDYINDDFIFQSSYTTTPEFGSGATREEAEKNVKPRN